MFDLQINKTIAGQAPTNRALGPSNAVGWGGAFGFGIGLGFGCGCGFDCGCCCLFAGLRYLTTVIVVGAFYLRTNYVHKHFIDKKYK